MRLAVDFDVVAHQSLPSLGPNQLIGLLMKTSNVRVSRGDLPGTGQQTTSLADLARAEVVLGQVEKPCRFVRKIAVKLLQQGA